MDSGKEFEGSKAHLKQWISCSGVKGGIWGQQLIQFTCIFFVMLLTLFASQVKQSWLLQHCKVILLYPFWYMQTLMHDIFSVRLSFDK